MCDRFLNFNRLNGTIPSSLANCPSLSTLYVLNSRIKESEMNFPRIRQLGFNELSGTIPSELFNHPTLRNLCVEDDLSHCLFQGESFSHLSDASNPIDCLALFP